MELIRVPISTSTKVNDLLCQTRLNKNEKGETILDTVKTPMCKCIESTESNPKKIVLIEGINNATPAVLDLINQIYGPSGTNILLENGKIQKGNVNIIGIFNLFASSTKCIFAFTVSIASAIFSKQL